MSKRKQTAADDDGDDSDVSLIDVDFEFFDPDPDVDYIALKRLIAQQFQADAEPLRPTDLADLILAEPRIGTTVKCDGPESDPYAFLTVVNMSVHRDHASIKALAEYALDKAAPQPAFRAELAQLLAPAAAARVGFVFCERLINMPVQVIPPMYRMLADELQAAAPGTEHAGYTHLLFVSRIYRLSAAEEADVLAAAPAPAPRAKKPKQRAAPAPARTGAGAGGTFSFHPEDAHVQAAAAHAVDYSFTHAPPREQDAFGLDTGGRMMLVPVDRFAGFVAAISEAYAVPA